MSKRLFTKCFSGEWVIEGQFPLVNLNLLRWLMQEDISILGVDMDVKCQTPSENDGFAHITLELSQNGGWGSDGSIATVSAFEGWNTVPQGICIDNGHTSFFFPDGKSIDIKEEGVLYLHSITNGKSAGQSIFEYVITIFYEKKGSR
ncbi:hypothetical protein ES705_44527 [subsurface metagenome]